MIENGIHKSLNNRKEDRWINGPKFELKLTELRNDTCGPKTATMGRKGDGPRLHEGGRRTK